MRQTTPGPTHEYAWPAVAIPIVSRISGNLDRLEVAREAAETILSYPSALPFLTGFARVGLALIAVQLDDATAAAEQYEAIREEGLTNPPGLSLSIERLLGLLSHTLGNLDQAVEHFENALAFCRNAGYRPELAWTCCDYADTLLQRASTSSARTESEEHRRKAMSLLDEALTISSELGMRPLMERVLSRRKILGA